MLKDWGVLPDSQEPLRLSKWCWDFRFFPDFFFFFSKFSSQQQLKRFLHFSLLLWVSSAKTAEIFQKTPNSILFWLSKATNNGPHGGNVECVHFAIWRKEREIQKFVLNLTKNLNFKVSKQKNSESQFIHSTAKNLFKEWLGHNVEKPFHFVDVIQIYLDIRLIHVYQVMDF